MRRSLSFFLAGAALLLAAAGPAGKPPSARAPWQPVEIREWTVPWESSRPRDPYVAPDSRIWFVGQRSDYVAVLDPENDEFRRYELESGTGPHNLIVGEDGAVWYAGNLSSHIGRLDPATGEIVRYPMPNPEARDPHTLAFDGQGGIWFTVQGGNFVGHLDTVSGDVRLVAVPTSRARPYGIVVDEWDRPWVALFGTHKLATVNPLSFALREIPLPRERARPRRIARTSDGAVWYVDFAEGYLGRYDPVGGTFREWPTPAGKESRPYALAADDHDRLWFVETGPRPNRFVGFDPVSEEFFSLTEIASGGGSVRHMVFDPHRRTIWFGTDTNTVGRASIP
ncbi:MAG: lyase [Gemmatimonadota bacterium]